MKTEKILQMLELGEIEELKVLLEKELKKKSISTSQRNRYLAIKRFFKFSPNYLADMCKFPCVMEGTDAQKYTFCLNGHALIRTDEIFEDLETVPSTMYAKEVHKLLEDYDERTGVRIDLNRAIAELNSKGYARKVSEVRCNNGTFPFSFYYDNAYYNAGLLETAYAIIANDEIPTVYHKPQEPHYPIVIKNSIGTAVVLPFRDSAIKDIVMFLDDFKEENK